MAILRVSVLLAGWQQGEVVVKALFQVTLGVTSVEKALRVRLEAAVQASLLVKGSCVLEKYDNCHLNMIGSVVVDVVGAIEAASKVAVGDR